MGLVQVLLLALINVVHPELHSELCHPMLTLSKNVKSDRLTALN